MKRKYRKMILSILFFTFLTLLLLFGVTACYASTRIGAEPESDYSALPNYNSEGFVNEEEMKRYVPPKSEIPFLRTFGRSENAPKTSLPVVRLAKADFPAQPEEFALYWLGHSTVIFELQGRRFLTDPVFGNAAPVPWILERYAESPIERGDLPPLDFILLTHDHYDHLEYETIRAFRESKTPFIAPLGVGAILRGWGIEKDRIHELNWGDSIEIGGLTVTASTARHFSGRSMGGRNRTLWCSYVIAGTTHKIFFGGDSGYGKHFKTIGEQYGPFDLVCLEIDAWNERWPNTHLFPAEVPQTVADLRGAGILPIHWGVFDMAMHPWDESIRQLSREKDLPLHTPMMGQKLIPGLTVTTPWWESAAPAALGEKQQHPDSKD